MKTVRVLKGMIAWSAVFAVSALLAQNVQASAITTISGSNAFLSPPAGGSSFSVDSYSVVSNGSPALTGSTASAVTYTLGNMSGGTGSLGLSSTFTLTNGTGTATFGVATPAANISGVSYTSNALSTTTIATLLSNTTGTDLGLNGTTWTFSTSITGITIASGNPASATFADSISVGFSLNDPKPPQPQGVPEPASLALWGAMSVAGMWYGRRKLQRKPAV